MLALLCVSAAAASPGLRGGITDSGGAYYGQPANFFPELEELGVQEEEAAAITLAVAAIERGEADVVIAGGSDSTSNAEIKLPQKVVRALGPMMMGKGKSTPRDMIGVLSQLEARVPFRDVLLRSLPGFAD